MGTTDTHLFFLLHKLLNSLKDNGFVEVAAVRLQNQSISRELCDIVVVFALFALQLDRIILQ